MLTISDNEEVQLEEPENIVMVELSTTPVATQPELEVAADDVPLYDVQQFYNSEQFTPSMFQWKVGFYLILTGLKLWRRYGNILLDLLQQKVIRYVFSHTSSST
jgi:hypothetical protein